jgi:diguanylate cyclase (GGDEF)-like protein/PAS domain S-box-containing protein
VRFRFPDLSLKTRMSVIMLGMVLAVTVLTTVASLELVRRDMQEVIGNEQFATLREIAHFVDEKFQSRRLALRSVTEGIPSELLVNPAGMQGYLARHASVRAEFFNLAAWDANGNLVASLVDPGMIGKISATKREYFTDTIKNRAGVISKPFISRISNTPTVLITEPVFDQTGAIVYVLTAGINLAEPTFLGRYQDMKFGRTGYLFILTTEGIIVAHPNKARLLQHYQAGGGTNAAAARALAGFEGSIEGTSTAGVHGVYSFKRLQSINWVFGSIFPAAEAFEPIDRLRKQAIIAAALLAILAGVLVWWLTRWQIAPLERLHHHILDMEKAAGYLPMAQHHRADEIGDLGEAFDSLMRERQSSEQKLLESEQRLRDITDNLPVLITYIDKDHVIRFANQTLMDWLEISPGHAVNRPLSEAIGADAYGIRREYIDRGLAGERVSFEMQASGSGRCLQTTYIPDVDPAGQVRGIYTVATDVTALKVVENQLRLLARYDSLTGLANRYTLNEKLAEAIARCNRTKRAMAVMYLDIDHFKSINDGLGHGVGDSVLCQFAERLVTGVRTTDTVSRLAGDEFVVLLEELQNQDEAGLIAEKVLTQVRRPFTVPAGTLDVTASIGVVFYCGDDGSSTSLLELADKALYRAKFEGRNTYRLDVFPGSFNGVR